VFVEPYQERLKGTVLLDTPPLILI